MAGVVVCHGAAGVRERLVQASLGVPALTPARGVSSVDELHMACRRLPPAMVLLDAHLPGLGVLEAIRVLRALVPKAAVVVLASPGDEMALDRAMSLGARGFLAPDAGRAELAAVAAHVLAAPPVPVPPVDRALGPADDAPPAVVLTKREIEVLVGMSHGRSNAQIGAELYLSEDTVKTHARRLFRKLGAADRAQAVAIGLRGGLIR